MSFQTAVVALIAFFNVIGLASAGSNPLGPYPVSDITVSGLSAGAFMAVQVHFGFSSLVNGSAIFAGGPYYCAQGSLYTAEYNCMKVYQGGPNIPKLVTQTTDDALAGLIDPIENLKDDRVYVFSGKSDSVVDSSVVHDLQTFYGYFVNPSSIVGDFGVNAEHCQPTVNYGENCGQLSSPYIGKCDFDGAGTALNVLYPGLKNSVSAVSGNLKSFKQSSYIPSGQSSSSSLDDTGYIYVPTACQSGTSTCHLHISFHGCLQTQADIGTDYATKSGYNDWAEANNIIVLYPYVKKSQSLPTNPNGCWDWWGQYYTGKDYAYKTGTQMQFVYNLIQAVVAK